MTGKLEGTEGVDYKRDEALIDSFLKVYPEYKVHLDEQYHVYPIEVDTVGEMIQVYDRMKQFFAGNHIEEPIVKANIQDVYDLILWSKSDQLKDELLEELDTKIEDLNERERLNYFHFLRKNLGSGKLNDEVDQFVFTEFESFNRIKRDSFLFQTLWEGISMLRAHCKKELKYLRGIEGGTEAIPIAQGVKPGQKLLLLIELGVIDHFKSTYDLNPNYGRMGRILEPLINVNIDTIRKGLSAFYTGNDPRNDPRTDENQQWLTDTMANLKLKVRDSK
jgi:hypothetical protein